MKIFQVKYYCVSYILQYLNSYQASLDMKALIFFGGGEVRGCNTLQCFQIESICSNVALSFLLKKWFPVFI